VSEAVQEVTTLDWLEAELRGALEGALASPGTFRVSVWCGDRVPPTEDDPGPFGWVPVAGGVSQWGLRRVLRHIRSCGWSDHTLLVEAEAMP
jgi:hypothetical protein